MTADPAGPYDPVLPRNERPGEGYRTVAEHLADALGNLPGADRLASELAARLGVGKTRELARAIDDATSKAIADAGEDYGAAVLAHTFEMQRERIAEQAPAEPSYRCAEDGCDWTSGALEPIEAGYAYVEHQDEHDDTDEDEPTGDSR